MRYMVRKSKKINRGHKMAKKDWIYSFFGGEKDFYGRAYLWMLTPRKTKEEVDSILKLLKPKPKSHILDWCGGWGRHSIGFAKRGFKVTLLDFCGKYIEKAEADAKKAGVKINTICTDFRKTPSSIQADYAVNLFTSGLGFLEEKDDLLALKSLHKALKPKAKLLIDTVSLFYIVKNYKEKDQRISPDKTKRFSEERKFDFWTNRNYSTVIFQDKTEKIEGKNQDIVHLYSPAELARVLKQAGFKPVELYGNFKGSEFSFDSKRIVMISVRP